MKAFNIIALLAAMLLAFVSLSQAASGFATSCGDIKVNVWGGLSARCFDSDDEERDALFPLSSYVENKGGRLEFGGSGYANSCINCKVVSTGILDCICHDWNRQYQYAKLDTNNYIANYDGRLFA